MYKITDKISVKADLCYLGFLEARTEMGASEKQNSNNRIDKIPLFFIYYFMVIIPFNTITTVIKEPEDQQRNHRIITNQRTNLENQKRHIILHHHHRHHHHLHRHHHHCTIFCAQECGAQGWVQPKAVAQDVIIVVASSP